MMLNRFKCFLGFHDYKYERMADYLIDRWADWWKIDRKTFRHPDFDYLYHHFRCKRCDKTKGTRRANNTIMGKMMQDDGVIQ
jgi:hypothetical protein